MPCNNALSFIHTLNNEKMKSQIFIDDERETVIGALMSPNSELKLTYIYHFSKQEDVLEISVRNFVKVSDPNNPKLLATLNLLNLKYSWGYMVLDGDEIVVDYTTYINPSTCGDDVFYYTFGIMSTLVNSYEYLKQF